MVTLILAFIAVISGFITVVSLIAWYQSATSSRWPSVSGEVIATDVVQKKKVKKDEVEIKHSPVIRYRYTVDGKEYENDRLNMGWTNVIRNEEIARQVTAKYPIGSKHDIFYNPKKPASSVLRPGESGGSSGMLIWPGLVLIVSVTGLVFS